MDSSEQDSRQTGNASSAHDHGGRRAVEAASPDSSARIDGNPDSLDFVRKVLWVAGILALAFVVWQIKGTILLGFAAILIAVFLRGPANFLSEHSIFTPKWAVVIVSIILVLMVGVFVWFTGPQVIEQFIQFTQNLPQVIEQLRGWLRQYEWGRYIADHIASSLADLVSRMGIFSRITGFASEALSVFTTVLMVFFAGLFLAFDPEVYKRGVVSLVPKERSERVRDALEIVGASLWKWLVGRLLSMTFVGVSVTVGLWLLGVPLALMLGLLAGLLDFVTYFGPLLSVAPAVLIAFGQGPMMALYVLLLYFVVQQLEGNIVSPIIHKTMVEIPPALVIFSIVAFGQLFGLMGFILGAPLALTGIVLIKMLYVEDVVGKPVDIPGR